MTARRKQLAFLNKYSLWSFALTVFFAVNMNVDWRQGYIVWYGSIALVLVSYALSYNGRIRLRLSSFLMWYISFVLLGVISFSWSLSVSKGFDVIKSLIVLFIILFVVELAISYGYEINTILKCYFIATFINTIYVLLTVDLSQLGDVQLGTGLLEGWNGNGIGFMTAQGAIIGVYLFGQIKSKLGSLLILIVTSAFSVLTALTGSRTAFIVLVVGFVAYFWLKKPTKLLRNIIITVFVLGIVFYLIMKVESFYNVLGSRFEGLFALFGGEGKVDSSASIRDIFIENGKRWFSENPIIGYGINNYKELNLGATGRHTYAHNNFIELAVDLGVVGLILYYSVYVYLVLKAIRKTKDNPLNSILVSLLIASLISQFGTVSYYGFYQNLILLLCFRVVSNAKNIETDNVKECLR